MTPFTPKQLRRIEKVLHPRPTVPKTGLEAFCRAENLSYSSMRKLLGNGLSRAAAAQVCRDKALIYIPRGMKWYEARRLQREV